MPAGFPHPRAGRGPLCRGHVPPGDRTSAVAAAGQEESAGPARRQGHGPYLADRAGKNGRSQAAPTQQGNHRRNSSPCSKTATPGGGPRPSGCCSNGKTRPRTSSCGNWSTSSSRAAGPRPCRLAARASRQARSRCGSGILDISGSARPRTRRPVGRTLDQQIGSGAAANNRAGERPGCAASLSGRAFPGRMG